MNIIDKKTTLIEYLQMLGTIEEKEGSKTFSLDNQKFTLTKYGNLTVEINTPKFENGKWYAFKEPGQEKLLVRVDDAERMICSGWNCKGQSFHKEWMYLGNRLIEQDWEHVYFRLLEYMTLFGKDELSDLFDGLVITKEK